MNRHILAIVTFMGGLFFALIILNSVLSGYGSNIAALAKFFAIGSFFIGLFAKKVSFYLLVIYAVSSDLLKRLLVLEESFNRLDILYILMMSPLLMAGIFLGVFVNLSLTRGFNSINRRALFIGILLSVMNFGIIGTSGGALGLLQAAANTASYFFIPFCALALFKNVDDYMKLLKFTVFAFIPVALYAMVQLYAGFNDVEYNYLISGYTTIVNKSNVSETRPFSTLSSPGALGYCVGVLGCLTFVFKSRFNKVRLNQQRIGWFNGVAAILLFAILMYGSICSKSRTQILVILCIIPYFYLLTNFGLTIFAYLSVISCTFFLFLFSGYILDYKLIDIYTREILPIITSVTGIDKRYFVLSTMNIRLEGWHAVMTNSEYWRPFGNPEFTALQEEAGSGQAARRMGVRSHDVISGSLLKVGFVPISVALSIAAIILFKVHKWVVSFPKGSFESASVRIGLLALFSCYLTTIAGGALTAYPVCLVLNLIFSLCFFSYQSQAEYALNAPMRSA